MLFVLYTIHVLISIFLILVVLLQQGKGADLSVFGGGGTQAAFGARGAASVLHKLTVICFVMFIVTTLSIGILNSRSGPSVMGGLDGAAPAEEGANDDAPTGPAGGVLPTDEPVTPAEEGAIEDGAEAPATSDAAPSAPAENPASEPAGGPPPSDGN